jgi:putative Ca2+/H+ antiporter (TMEM165/GDT1 family)
MDLKVLATVFTAVFIAELGDKTQLATLLFAADRPSARFSIFAGASLALILASAIGVLAGGMLAEIVDPRWLRYVAGAGFVAIGVWTLVAA